jgi:hypothetical protein
MSVGEYVDGVEFDDSTIAGIESAEGTIVVDEVDDDSDVDEVDKNGGATWLTTSLLTGVHGA